MKRLLIFLFFLGNVVAVKSQNLTVEGTAPNLFITHIVAPKENFYSVGRLYNQAPKVIASFNNITMEKGLTIGQHIKIPLTPQNLGGSENAGTGETLIPITHIVTKSETLFKIGSDHNATAQSIRQWNNLSSDNITPGSALIVGHLKIGGNQSSANASTAATGAPIKTNVPAPGREVAGEPKQVVSQPKKEEPVATVTPNTPVTAKEPEAKEVVISEQTKPAETKKEERFTSADSAPVIERKEEVTATTATSKPKENTTDALVKEQPVKEKPVQEAPLKEVVTETPVKPQETGYLKNAESSLIFETGNIAGGAFAGTFSKSPDQKSLHNKSGEAATFKSTSGWQDKKYYVLMNDVAPGTIIKISSSNNKVVYAKVLGNMPEMKENVGLLLRISNSAASSLGIIDPKFPVEVSYY